jgi:hypothetical protein
MLFSIQVSKKENRAGMERRISYGLRKTWMGVYLVVLNRFRVNGMLRPKRYGNIVSSPDL